MYSKYLKSQDYKDCLLLTDRNVPEGGVVGETKLGLEGGQNFLFDLFY